MIPDTSENGKSLWHVIRTIGAIASVLLVLGIVLKFFLGVLFGDSIVEETIKEVSGRALSISTRLISGQDKIDNDGSPTTARGFPVSAYPVEGGFFEITLTDVPKDVCKGIATRGWNLPTSIYINGRLSDKQVFMCGTHNQISFEFTRDLNGNVSNAFKPAQKHCQSDSDCSGCEACQNGRCISGCKAGEKCALTLKGRSVCCSETKTSDPMCCSFVEGNKCCWGRNQCCPKEKPIRLADGTCTDCYDKHVWGIGEPVDLGLCKRLCPNRVDFGADNLCMLPLCQKGEFTDRNGDCIACSAAGGYQTSSKECSKCPNRSYQDGWCLTPCPKGTILDKQNQCTPCDSPERIEVADGIDCSASCPNREQQSSVCVLKECPEGFAPNTIGDCFDCQEPKAVPNVSIESCALCPNRVYENGKCLTPCPDNTFRDKDGVCVSCANPAAVPVVLNELECQKCPERLGLNGYCFAACETGQFRDAFGTCHSCFDLGSYPVLQTAICSTCLNRSILLHQLDNQIVPYCMLQYCPLDFFVDKLGTCHDCFDKASVTGTRQEECEKCPNRQWSFVEETCRIKPNCAGGEIINAQGACQSCHSDEEAISVEGHPEECLHCSGRYLFGSWCRKCPEKKGDLKNREACEKCGGTWDNRIQTCTAQ
ncbi:MAG: hypothetical protein IKS41_03855 [Alphaproteobacteria bacterium]|nr:hypothetical protein [Alphaproteobacteria bacterium]